MSGNYFFDTNTIIYFLKGMDPWVRFVNETHLDKCYASIITRMELLSWPSLSPTGQTRIKEFLSELTVCPLNEDVEAQAIALRRSTKLKLPDAIIVASALHTDSTLITHDKYLVDLDWSDLRIVDPCE